MPRLGVAHRGNRDSTIQCRKAAAVLHGEREQINVRELLWAEDMGGIKARPVDEGNIVGPEGMIGVSNLRGKELKRLGGQDRTRVARLRKDPHESIFGERARRPAVLAIPGPPLLRPGMMDMLLIEHR